MSRIGTGAALTVALMVLFASALAVSPTGVSASEGTTGPRFACDDKDTVDKGWVLPVYVHFPGDDRYDAEVGLVRRALWQTDQTFDLSAHRFGVSRRLRFVQDDQCVPVVAKLAFEKGRDRSQMHGALVDDAANQPQKVREILVTKRYQTVFFARSDEITNKCTGGGADAGLSGGNVIMSRWCWGEAGLTHEMIHSFGLSHCNQSGRGPNGNDPVCRGYGTKPECTTDTASEYHLDSCRTDDFRYFEPTQESQPKPEPLPRNRNVAFSPYLITDQPSPALDFRLKSVPTDTGLCVDGAEQNVVLHKCSDSRTQIWRRSINRDGYLTIRNLGTGQCLTMHTTPDQATAAVETAPCQAGEASQQWLPSEDHQNSNLLNRTGGMRRAALHIAKDKADGAPLTRGTSPFQTEWVGSTPAPDTTANPTPTSTTTPMGTTTQTTTHTTTTAPATQAGPHSDTLASTGFDRAWLIAPGAVLLLGGAALVAAMRRRDPPR
ncbi:ricin-type beta-trefoil lectin protein [Saccharothrix variisporea]|uniref:Ricin-type beta-trefoil lectin protein n=2 Tax=Saccharothrix variisporea TaxID=543527 RepID=A0A495XK10_9PSEU|nr:ricin-type beta-trefoil lectin protein [Saccharothrix variisporea]